jgi:hypothetical protein
LGSARSIRSCSRLQRIKDNMQRIKDNMQRIKDNMQRIKDNMQRIKVSNSARHVYSMRPHVVFCTRGFLHSCLSAHVVFGTRGFRQSCRTNAWSCASTANTTPQIRGFTRSVGSQIGRVHFGSLSQGVDACFIFKSPAVAYFLGLGAFLIAGKMAPNGFNSTEGKARRSHILPVRDGSRAKGGNV